MKKFVCSVCGYVHVGDSAPAECPICHAGADKFVEQKDGELEWAVCEKNEIFFMRLFVCV